METKGRIKSTSNRIRLAPNQRAGNRGSESYLPHTFERRIFKGFGCAVCRKRPDRWIHNFELKLYRVYPGTEYCVDGFVQLCVSCLARFSRSHLFKSTMWKGPTILRPVPGVPVDILGYGFADDQRVANLFANVWEGIARTERKQIVRYLQSKRFPQNIRHPTDITTFANRSLRIDVVPHWPGRQTRLEGVNMLYGHAIRLWATVVNAMPDNALKSLIGHELAHTFQWASQPNHALTYDKDRSEREAESIADSWGCGIATLEKWERSIKRIMLPSGRVRTIYS